MKHKLYLLTFLASLTISSSSFAAQMKDMEDGDEAVAEISKSDINRIKLSGDRIRATNANAGEMEISKDNITGEIFIRATKYSENKPLNIFITSEQNFTYKLLLYPKAIPAEQIIIKNDAVVSHADEDVAKISKNSYQQQIIALLKAMRTKSKLEQYQISNLRKNIDLGDLTLKRTSTYKGQNFIGETFLLINDSNKVLELEEKMFFKNGVRAIKIENPMLLPDEATEIFIVS